MPLNWLEGPDQEVAIGTRPGLKYDIEELSLKRGTRVALSFNNNDDMLHNLVFTSTAPNAADKVGNLALQLGLDGADLNYVPDSDLVIVHTGIVQPGSSEQIYFQVPWDPGEYWIVCTFPGHAASMRIKVIVA